MWSPVARESRRTHQSTAMPSATAGPPPASGRAPGGAMEGRNGGAVRAPRVTAGAIAVASVAGGGGNTGGTASVSPTAPTLASATPTPAPIKGRGAYGNVTAANLAPFYAKEKGIFLQNGLDVDLSLIDGGGKSMAALLGNSVDIAQLGGTETMSAYVGGGDVQAVALFVPVSPWVLMAPSSYTGPTDRRGKPIRVA